MPAVSLTFPSRVEELVVLPKPTHVHSERRFLLIFFLRPLHRNLQHRAL